MSTTRSGLFMSCRGPRRRVFLQALQTAPGLASLSSASRVNPPSAPRSRQSRRCPPQRRVVGADAGDRQVFDASRVKATRGVGRSSIWRGEQNEGASQPGELTAHPVAHGLGAKAVAAVEGWCISLSSDGKKAALPSHRGPLDQPSSSISRTGDAAGTTFWLANTESG